MRRIVIGFSVLFLIFGAMWGAWRLSKSRSHQLFGGLITHADTRAPLVALTLDDGPTPQGTDFVLPILDSLNVKATFFVTGRELERNPEYGRRIVEAGHALGNHSYSHSRMVLRSTDFVRREIEQTDSLIKVAGWEGDIPFRPPYGMRLFVLPRYLHRTGRSTLLWDIEPESYPEIAASAEHIADHVMERVQPGSIILLHIMYESRVESRRALPLVIERVLDKGYRFVTVQELLSEQAR